ncbi:MAG: tyrosine--tRNA ligase [Bacilli bacterium]|nr:tyrosine--tRNA ligase [Bacilli bacterium]
MSFYQDLVWRGLVGQTIGNVEELLKTPTTFYCGFDSTSISKDNLNPNYPEITSSLHIGHLLALITCKRFQLNGHKPIMLVGGFTALIGDGSFRTEDRALLSFEEVENNTKCISKQIQNFVNCDGEHGVFVNNYDWFKEMSLLEYLRGACKAVSLNYMLTKDSIRNRLEREGCGISLAEASYGIFQSLDHCHLNQVYGCKLSVNGTDQIGNATYSSIIGRKLYGLDDSNFNVLAWPLVTKSDGSKFGKSMSGKCIWLDKHLTTPYEFYQFWLNVDDSDAERFIKMFTLLSREEIESLIEEHRVAPHLRILQKRLAIEVTTMVHGKDECRLAMNASEVLFGNCTESVLKSLDEKTFLSVFEGVPIFKVNKNLFSDGVKLTELSVEHSNAFKSKGELRKLITNGGISINKNKIDSDITLYVGNLINDKFLIIQQGKKKYNLIIAE